MSQERSRVGRSGLGQLEVERGSQKWIEGVRNGAGESKVDWGSHEWLHVISIRLRDYQRDYSSGSLHIIVIINEATV